MRKINREWHAAHPMPERPTLEERLAWHEKHAAACGCREMPGTVRLELEKRKNMVSDRREPR